MAKSKAKKTPVPNRDTESAGGNQQRTLKSPKTQLSAEAQNQDRDGAEKLPMEMNAPLSVEAQRAKIANGAPVALTLPEKIKELLRLAQEQGYLTYNDINDALPADLV